VRGPAVNQMMVQGEVDRADGPQVDGVPLAELGQCDDRGPGAEDGGCQLRRRQVCLLLPARDRCPGSIRQWLAARREQA
jgi:hypothetical protein